MAIIRDRYCKSVVVQLDFQDFFLLHFIRCIHIKLDYIPSLHRRESVFHMLILSGIAIRCTCYACRCTSDTIQTSMCSARNRFRIRHIFFSKNINRFLMHQANSFAVINHAVNKWFTEISTENLRMAANMDIPRTVASCRIIFECITDYFAACNRCLLCFTNRFRLE